MTDQTKQGQGSSVFWLLGSRPTLAQVQSEADILEP